MNDTELNLRIGNILGELENAINRYPKFASAHEGYAVLLKEMTELQTAVFMKPVVKCRQKYMEREAIQVAAMALRFLIDCCPMGPL